MDLEASGNDEHLSASIQMRRRSTSFSDDYSVQKTNDDATQCKFTAVQLGYWDDEFIKRFAYGTGGGGEPNSRRDPEISIGYWARVAAVNHYINHFIDKTDGKCQIVSFGSGFDTLFWRLKSKGRKFLRYVEVDFSSVTSKKIRQIKKPGHPDLQQYFEKDAQEAQHSDLHCGDYHLVGADIRQWGELKGKLDSTGLDASVPTMFLAECVLVYMSADQSSQLLKNLTDSYETAVFLNYEQLRTTDTFGKVMEKNLEQRGIVLAGLAACQDEETQKKRFTDSGFAHVTVMDMNVIYNKVLPQDEVKRVRAIEHLDEMELLEQLLAHYCIVYAVNDRTDSFTSRLCIRDE